MALINIDTIIQETRRQLKKMQAPGGIELLSYKRNRSIAILLLADGRYLVRENGYRTEEKSLQPDELPRDLKVRVKREFPRSRKVRLFKFQDPAQLDRIHQKI